MNRYTELPQRFAARRSIRNTLIFCIAFGGFGIFGLVLLVLGERVGWVLVAFSAAFLALLLLVNLKPGWGYLVDRSGISAVVNACANRWSSQARISFSRRSSTG